MSEKLNLLQRLQAVMNEPGADYIQKSQKKINGQYTAVSHDAVARKLHPLFKKHGVIVMPSVMPETVRMSTPEFVEVEADLALRGGVRDDVLQRRRPEGQGHRERAGHGPRQRRQGSGQGAHVRREG
jgi:uncharacterized protein YllA (UPF0747 family)